MKIRDIMTDNPITVAPETTIYETARLMQEHNIGAIPVSDSNQKLVGIVTDRDIIVRNVANGVDVKTAKAQDIMTKNVISVSANTDATCVAQIMSNDRIRRIPVVEDNQVIGMISLGDLAVTNSMGDETADALSEISQGCQNGCCR